MIIDSPIISGSQLASGPLTQIGNVEITGSLSVTGTINGSITGSVTSASYATSAEFLDGLDSTSFVFTSSFNTFSGSAAGRITNLEAFSSSLDATFATDASVTASILVLSQSVQVSQAALSSSYTITSGSYASASGSLSIRTTNLEATSSTLVAASSSFAADSASLSTRLTGDEANITTLTSASGSFAAQSASLSTRITQDETNFTNLSSSFATTSGSLSTRVTNLESTSSTVSSSFASTSGSISGRVTLIEGQYATTGSNVFTGPQFINQASNAIGFDSTASLYTDGGLRVSKDSFVSGTAYFNNVVVYGTSSIQYITSSQVNFGTNIITVNTDTPAVRFGGLAVFDSGSTQLTGSILWDSEKNHWIYSNPSGSMYNSAMLMNGPRNTGSLGSEQGTTACALMMGQGGDHITSSMIYSYGNATCFYGQSYISSSGAACFAGYGVFNSCLGIGTAAPSVFGVDSINASNSVYYKATSNTTTAYYGAATALGTGVAGTFSNHDFALYSNSVERARITATGIACFACQVCAPAFVGGTVSGTAGTFSGSSTLLTLSSGAGTKAVFATTRNFGVNRNFQIAVDEFAESAFTITPSTTLGGSGYTTPIFTLAAAGTATFACSVQSNYLSSVISSSSNASPLILQNTAGWASSQITSVSVKDGSDVVGAIGWKYDGIGNVDMLFHSLYNGAYKNTSNVVMTVKGTGNVGIGTISPCTNFDLRVAMTTATCGAVANSFPIATFAINSSDNGCRGLQIGSTPGGIGGAPVFLKVFGTSAPFAIINQSNCQNFIMSDDGSVTMCATTALRIPTGTTAQRPTGAAGMVRMNTTTGQPEWYNTATSTWATFNQNVNSYMVEYLVVGGGGGGGYDNGAGGGAGGFVMDCGLSVSSCASYSVIVGAGGTATTGVSGFGGASCFNSVVALGGGGGGAQTHIGGDGGSGGGSMYYPIGPIRGGFGTIGQGFEGGCWTTLSSPWIGSGGGGASERGFDGPFNGMGGAGKPSTLLGNTCYYAGGGNGSGDSPGCQTQSLGGGGIAGNPTGGNGNTNSGSGGGGGINGGNFGGNGGSGVVIIRYPGCQRGTGGTICSYCGTTIHVFLSSGTFVA